MKITNLLLNVYFIDLSNFDKISFNEAVVPVSSHSRSGARR